MGPETNNREEKEVQEVVFQRISAFAATVTSVSAFTTVSIAASVAATITVAATAAVTSTATVASTLAAQAIHLE